MRDGGLPRTVCFYLHSANSTSKTAGLNADKISTNGKKSKKTSLKIRQKGQNKAFGQNICEKLFVHLNFYLLLRADWKCHATKQPRCAHFPGAFTRRTPTISAAKASSKRLIPSLHILSPTASSRPPWPAPTKEPIITSLKRNNL